MPNPADAIKEVFDKIREVGYAMVDALLAWLLTFILSWLNQPDLLVIGDGPPTAVSNLSPFVFFVIVRMVRQLLSQWIKANKLRRKHGR